MVFLGMTLGFIVSKEGKLPNPKKVEAIIKLHVPNNLHNIQVFNNLAQFYRCFVNFFTFTMAPITKLMRKSEEFIWTQKCQDTLETINWKYVEVLILIDPNWEKDFHVHTKTSTFAVKAMLA
jgi:hypothetical protein